MAKNNLTREEFEAQLSELAEDLRELIEAEVDGFKHDPIAGKKRIAKGKDLEYFSRTYFPHYIKADKSVLHEYLFQRLPAIIKEEEGQRDAIAAPRGEAKSTICSLIFFIYCIVYELKHNMLLIMDTYEQSAEAMEGIKAELEFNPRLKHDFPNAAGKGRVWREGLILTNNSRKLQGFGTAKKVRGKRHGPHRPDLTVLDDIENDENVENPDQREKLEKFLNKTVSNLSAADDSMDIVYIGTILHYDSVLARTLANTLWDAKKFQALIKWPDRMDLWDKWEEILLNASKKEALAFYTKRKKNMEKGSIVSWPSMRPLYKLMVKRAREGHEAFDAEMQNDPISMKDAAFGEVTFWVHPYRHWIFYGACDPSLGKHGKRRDPSAILVGGFDRESGVLDVVEASISKRLPDKIISDIIAYQKEYNCLVWHVEAVQFQEFLRTELVKRSAQQGIPVPALPTIPHNDKDLRIETLQPHVKNKLIRFHPAQKTLLQQLRHWPKADHDDGPDALEILWKLAISRAGGITKVKTRKKKRDIYKGYD